MAQGPEAQERLAKLRLIRTENVGPVTFHRLMQRFGTAVRALDALPEMARRGGRRAPLTPCPRAEAEAELTAAAAVGAQTVFYGEAAYPPLLTAIPDAPALLCVRGHAHLLKKRVIAVVGARNASLNGRRFAERLAADLGTRGLCVASGLARGIDTAVHQGALASGTVAVVAGGVDVVYPPENADLHAAIAENGAVISEMPPGARPQARHFPTRNRILAGLGRGVVVVEASPRSGSLITARLAADYGREVFAVPGAAGDPRARGANQLIRDGAVLTEHADDILDALTGLDDSHLSDTEPSDSKGAFGANPSDEVIDEARRWIESVIGAAPVTVDEIMRDGQFSTAAVAGALLELEIAGRLERHPGGRVALLV
jgi:DNA processing protein